MLDPATDPFADLRADCTRCVGLCCVAPAFAASTDFAVDKPAGQACANLQADFRCGIHEDLRERGFAGCTVFDCFGAGQQVVGVTFAGQDGIDPRMFPAFTVQRQLHEMLWYLTEALTLEPARSLHDEVRALLKTTRRLTAGTPDELAALDVAAHRGQVAVLLRGTSELVRAGAPDGRVDRSGADLVGKRLRGADLRGANLRGSYLIGADLRAADLRLADLIGADLRAADLRGADLSTCIFLTQFQVNAAAGDAGTRLPAALARPPHWSGTSLPIAPVGSRRR